MDTCITGVLWRWLRAYLTDRQQCVSISGCHSSPLPVVSGVPQESILGLLLFLIFVNDLPSETLSSSALLFADDTTCAKSISGMSDCISLQTDLNRLWLWSQDWNLHFSEEKCVVMRFTTKCVPIASTFQYFINDEQLTVKGNHLILTSDLNWHDHCDQLLKKAYKILGLLGRTFHNTRCIQTKEYYISRLSIQTAILLSCLAPSGY